MKIVFATCLEIPQGTEDDLLLRRKLESDGHHVDVHVWTDPQVSWHDYDICLIRSTWDYHKKLSEFLDWAQRVSQRTRLVNPLSVLKWNCDKNYLLEFHGKGLPIVPTFIAKEKEVALQEGARLLGQSRQIIVKPTISATADLTFVVRDEIQLEAGVRAVLARGPVMLQPFLPSVLTDGELSLIYFYSADEKKLTYSHAVLKTAKAGDFRVQSDFGGKSESLKPPAVAHQLADQIAARLPRETCYARIDLLDWKTQPLIGEVELIEPDLFFRFLPAPGNLRHSFGRILQWLR
jgi:hypothetical protein